MTPLDAALRYAAKGWPVFPCRGKIPLTAHGFHDASTHAATVEAWWRHNPDALISVATGCASRVVVLDVDVKQRGPNGWDALEKLGVLPLVDTPMSMTPSGGTHVFFDPGELEVPLAVGKIGAQLDVRGERSCCTFPTPGTAYRCGSSQEPEDDASRARSCMAHSGCCPACNGCCAGLPAAYGRDFAVRRVGDQRRCESDLRRSGRPAIDHPEPRAFGIGGLVGAGQLPERTALDALMQAAFAMPTYDRRRPGAARMSREASRLHSSPEFGSRAVLQSEFPPGYIEVRPTWRPNGAGGDHSGADVPDVADLPLVCAASFAGKPVPERRWIVRDMIPDKTVTLVSGDGGVGKSLLIGQLGIAVAASAEWIGTLPERGPVVFVSAEDDLDELHRRVVAITNAQGIDIADLVDLHFVPLAGSDAVMGAPEAKTGHHPGNFDLARPGGHGRENQAEAGHPRHLGRRVRRQRNRPSGSPPVRRHSSRARNKI